MFLTDEKKTACLFAAALAALPLLAICAPRALAGLPGMIGLAGFLALALHKKTLPVFNKPAVLISFGILALSLCSALWAGDPVEVLGRTGKSAPILLGFVLLESVIAALPADAVNKSMRLMPWSVILASAVLTIEYETGFPLYRLMNGIVPDAAINASLLNRGIVFLSLCVFPAMAFCEKPWLAVIVLCAAALPVFLSDSQSAQMGLLAGLLCFAIFPRRHVWAWRGLAVLVASYFVLMPWMAQNAFAWADAVNASPYFGKGGAYGAQRLEIWHFISASIFQHPVLGYGTEAARTMRFVTEQRFFDSETVLHPHNVALQIWLEFGLLGIFAACVLIGWLLEKTRRMHDRARCFVLPLFIMTVAIASTAYGMWQGWWLGLLTLLAAYALMIGKTRPSQDELA